MEEQKVITLYETIKGRTGIPKAQIPIKSNKIIKGRTESHDPI